MEIVFDNKQKSKTKKKSTMINHLLITKITILLKATGVLAITWFTELFIEKAITVSIISPEVKDFFLDVKPIINTITSILVMIFTIYKFKKENKNNSNKEKKENE